MNQKPRGRTSSSEQIIRDIPFQQNVCGQRTDTLFVSETIEQLFKSRALFSHGESDHGERG